ncbi:MAG: hypothetical protein WDO12_12590 [Pseudomonadota bacterium]
MKMLSNSHDPYALMRNAYLQRRAYQVKDGTPSTDDDVEIIDDDASSTAAPAATAPAASPGKPAQEVR